MMKVKNETKLESNGFGHANCRLVLYLISNLWSDYFWRGKLRLRCLGEKQFSYTQGMANGLLIRFEL